MRVTFLAPAARHPVGGVKAIYEFANGLTRRGHVAVLAHFPFARHTLDSLDDIGWYTGFEPGLRHCFDFALPEADFLVGYHELIPRSCGLPAVLFQGYRALQNSYERSLFDVPCPVVCVAEWLVDVARDNGVDDRQLVHVPYGLDHRLYRSQWAVEDRPLIVSMCYSSHPSKGGGAGLAALDKLKRRFPALEAVVFGTTEPAHRVPAWMAYRRSPPQSEIVDAIYGASRVFLSPSTVEGFGFPALEAMTCGAALVVTDNGGSRDYAVDGHTAVVVPSNEPDLLADAMEALLADEARRVALARRGMALARRFDWDRSAELFESFLAAYGADPDRYWRPLRG